MNGYDVAQAIRTDSELKNTYLVALSGYSQPSDRKQQALISTSQSLLSFRCFAI